MLKLLKNFGAKRASTKEEFEAIYRLRYRVYIEELHKETIENVDHENRFIRDPQDETRISSLFYTGGKTDPTGTIRVDVWPPDEVPEDVRKRFSLDSFSEFSQMPICEVSRFVISSTSRGSIALAFLAKAALICVCCEKELDFAFLYCAPGLIKVYRKLGFRPYGASLISSCDGVKIPMLNITTDVDYYKRVHSPLATMVAKFRRGKDPKRRSPDRLIEHLRGKPPVETEEKAIWEELQNTILEVESTSRVFLDGLSENTARLLSKHGFLIDVGEGETVVRETLVEKEMFLILDGLFEVARNEERIALLERGDVFGELAFFRENSERTADVRSLSKSRLFVLERKFLKRLMHEEPKAASEILYKLCETLSERMAGLL